jgi:hypothetical protein
MNRRRCASTRGGIATIGGVGQGIQSESVLLVTPRDETRHSGVEISQNNWQAGQTHYDWIVWMRQDLLNSDAGPRPMKNVKVYGRARPSVPAELSLSLDRYWQNIFGGCASTRFHRPPAGWG